MIEPCIGCGYCCQAATCCLGLLTFDRPRGQCPALIFEEGRFWCRIVKGANGVYRERLIRDLAIGGGCLSSLCNSQRDACQRGELEKYLQWEESQRMRYGS